MAKILVLAEKPSVGRDIARVLGCKNEKNGYIEGNKYIVTWALGHLVTLADPETYDKKYKSWDMSDLPILPKDLKTVVIKKSAKQFNTVKAQLNRNDVSEVVIATDAGREGELVARWIIEKAHIKKPIKRLWISSSTDKAIKEGFTKLKDAKEYNNLYYSAIARAEADWIVGINATRALTTKYNASLSCGRVQTPTLAMILKREDEIRNFKPKDYYTLDILTEKGGNYLKLSWHDKNNSTSTFNKEKIENIKKKVLNKDLKIVDVKKSNKKKYAPSLYDLTELQRDANKMFGYSAKETLSIMQKLYEHHKVLTYPRTDSRYLTDDIVDTLKDRIKAVNTSEYSKVCMKLLKTKIKPNKSFVDNSKVTDHHAIIPTEERVFLGDLSDKERKIYDLVVKRFLSVLCPPFEYEQTTIKGSCEGETFTAKGNKIIKLGWRENYTVDDNETYDGIIDINVDEVLKVESVKIENKKTNPPSYLNEATLLTEMEKHNLGTVATRADIIEKLFNSFFVEMKNKEIHITSKGRQLLDLAPKDLKSPELTAKWEKTLNDISKGKSKKNEFLNEMKNYSKTIVKEIKNSENKFKHDNLTRNKCPECGNKRKAEEKGKASKKDINKYLKNQNKEQEAFNNPFAALANLKNK